MIDNSVIEVDAITVEPEAIAADEETAAEEISPALLSALEQYKVKASDYKKDTGSIVDRLVAMQEMTGEVFLNIANKLPGINQGLRGVESEADNLLEYFHKESSFLDCEDTENRGDLNRLNNASRYLIEIAASQGEALLKINDMMTRIDSIKTSTESIRDFSADMEMLSLNAAIVAIKAGELGRTLNPITTELKKMANASIALIDGIVKNSDELVDTYNQFQELTEKQVQYHKADADRNSENLAVKYEGLQAGINLLINNINDTNTAVKEARQSISAIMNALQVQDILRQCTDHIRLALDETRTEIDALVETGRLGSIQPEHLLDSIEFQEQVPNLCIKLLLDVRTRLSEAAQSLVMEFKRIDSLMAGLNTCSMTNSSGELKNSAVNQLEEAFKEVGVVIADTANMISGTANTWEQLRATAEQLTAIMGDLEKQFQKLKKTTNFHVINIPVKIEVARSFGQSKDGELASRVDGLAEFISTEMKKSYKDVLESRDFLGQLVISMNKDKQAVDMRLDAIAEDIDDVLGKFNQVKEQVKTAFKGVCEHVGDLSELVQASLLDLNRVSNLADESAGLENELRDLVEVARQAKGSLLAVIDKGDWQIHDNRLNDIVEKFTVLSHKKIAESLFEIAVEDGNHEGELILF